METMRSHRALALTFPASRNHPAADFAYHVESVACGPESSTRPIANYNPISLTRESPMT
jgi:hypothetical protein